MISLESTWHLSCNAHRASIQYHYPHISFAAFNLILPARDLFCCGMPRDIKSTVIDEWCNFTPNLPRPRSTELNPKNEAKQRNLLSLAASLPVEDRVLSMLQDIFWLERCDMFVGMYVVADMTSLSRSSLSSSLPLFVTCSSPFRKEQHGSRNIQYRVYLYLTRLSFLSFVAAIDMGFSLSV